MPCPKWGEEVPRNPPRALWAALGVTRGDGVESGTVRRNRASGLWPVGWSRVGWSRVGYRGKGCPGPPLRRILVHGEIICCLWGAAVRRTRRAGRQAAFLGAVDPLWVGLGGRDLGVDSLATELVIDRGLAHG